VTFAAEVEAQVIAEGVENDRELGALERLHVPWMQGYHLGRPQGISDLAARAGRP
jgi:EAL domain-containing protein (putative c-di-GMP-specific phosphodiesterase class I)